MTNELIFAHDAGHGWLRVPHTMLMQLKIDWAISEYSYVEPSPLGDLYWLEEDCDAPLFLEAYRAARHHLPWWTDRDDGALSPIRSLPRNRQPVDVGYKARVELTRHYEQQANSSSLVAA